MARRGNLGVVLLVASLLSSCTTSRAKDPITYVDVSRTFTNIIENSIWTSRAISAYEPDVNENVGLAGRESLSSLYADCSDSNFLCARNGIDVFAIPRSRIQTRSYVANGVRFRIEKCIRGNTDHCSVFLISGTCDELSDVLADGEQECRTRSLEPDDQKREVAYVKYFVFNDDYGVTAFGVTSSVRASESDQLSILTQAVLTSNYGILCCRSRPEEKVRR